MKNIRLMLWAAFVLSSCSKSNTEIKKRITNSDSVAINYFKGDGTMDTVVAIKIIRNKQQVEQLANMVAEQSAKVNYKCGYDGSIHFFKMNKVIQDIDFRMNGDDCMNFSFLQYGKTVATALSPEAKELINSFRK